MVVAQGSVPGVVFSSLAGPPGRPAARPQNKAVYRTVAIVHARERGIGDDGGKVLLRRRTEAFILIEGGVALW